MFVVLSMIDKRFNPMSKEKPVQERIELNPKKNQNPTSEEKP
jgi:hypothetical protein